MSNSELSLLLYFISIGIMLLPVIFKILGLFMHAKVMSYISMVLGLLCIAGSIIIDIKMSGQASFTNLLIFIYLSLYIILWLIEVILLRKEAVITGVFVTFMAIAKIIAVFFLVGKKSQIGSLILSMPGLIFTVVILITNIFRFKRHVAKVGKRIKEIHAMKDEVESIDDIIT